MQCDVARVHGSDEAESAGQERMNYAGRGNVEWIHKSDESALGPKR